MRFVLLILCLGALSACTDRDAARYQFGVSAVASPSAPDQLAWKANQICTLGYQVVKQDTVSAEGGARIVDNHLQCNDYHPSLDAFAVNWASIF
jgi:hypothetical protein